MVSEATVEAIGGAVGSVIAIGVTYPLTTISTWQALDHKDEDRQSSTTSSSTDSSPGKPFSLSLPSPIREIILYSQTKGWTALFSGLRPCLAATAVSQAAYFYMYSSLRQAVVAHLQQQRSKTPGRTQDARTADIGVLGSILVASLSGCGTVLLTNPVWVVATQLLANGKSSDPAIKRMTTAQVCRRLYVESGLMGFWKGLLPSLVMVVNPTLQYIFYEWLTSRLLELRRSAAKAPGARKGIKVAISAGDVFALTALAKLGATLLTYPMFLVKSRLQAMNKSTDKDAQYTGVADAARRILQAEGFRGFFKGIQMKMMQTVLSAALLMAIKEKVYVSTRKVLLPSVSPK